MRERRVFILKFLQVVRQYYATDSPLVVSDPHRAVDQMAHLGGDTRKTDIFADIFKQVLEINFLLITRPQSGSRQLADKRHHGNMIHLGVVQSIQQMDRARARGRIAKPDLAGKLGMCRGHERRHLLVADLYVLHPVLGFLERHVEASDSVTRVTIDPSQPPFGQSLPNIFADVHACPPDEAPSRPKFADADSNVAFEQMLQSRRLLILVGLVLTWT